MNQGFNLTHSSTFPPVPSINSRVGQVSFPRRYLVLRIVFSRLIVMPVAPFHSKMVFAERIIFCSTDAEITGTNSC